MANARGKLVALVALVAAVALVASAPGPARADSAPEATRSAARARGEQGLQLYEAKRWTEAFTAFHEADDLYHAPTLTLFMGHCRRSQGLLVEARALYTKFLDPVSKRCYLDQAGAQKSWAGARSNCMTWGGDLAAVSSDVELDFIAKKVGSFAWTGALRVSHRRRRREAPTPDLHDAEKDPQHPRLLTGARPSPVVRRPPCESSPSARQPSRSRRSAPRRPAPPARSKSTPAPTASRSSSSRTTPCLW